MSPCDRQEFREYLKGCTDSQVRNCLEKERSAYRFDYAELCEDEMEMRGLS
jgi:hypothetical protein